MANPIPPPVQDPVSQPEQIGGKPNPLARLIGDAWLRFFNSLSANVSTSANRVSVVTLTGQKTALGGTPLLPTIQNSGIYRLSYYMRVTTAAGVSSSLQVTLGWADHGVNQSFTGAALTSNTTISWQNGVLPIYADANAPITYSTAYASNPASAMVYQLYLTLEAISI